MAKMRMRTPKTARRPIILPSFQLYVVPPHCRTRRRHTTAGIRKNAPMKSSCFKRSMRVAVLWARLKFMKITMPVMVIAPIGRLM